MTTPTTSAEVERPVDLDGLSPNERHVLEHTTGWKSRQPLFRNHFVAGEGHDDWPALQALCGRGLMYVSRQPSELSGGDFVFSATEAGVAALRTEDQGRTL